jgi:hypothetical protein
MNDTPTPETDGKAYVSVKITADGPKDGPLVVPADFACKLECERDAALDALRKWDAVCVAADACNAEMESDEYSQTQWEAFEQKHTDLLESANRARLAVLFPANSHVHPPDMPGDATLNQPEP